MQRLRRRAGRIQGQTIAALMALSLSVCLVGASNSPDQHAAGRDGLWQRTMDLVRRGQFTDAGATIEELRIDERVVDQVRSWLRDYKKEQEARAALNREDFEKYVRYAQERIEREEYRHALDWALAALDCASDRDAFLQSPWPLDLVDKALEAAQGYRGESNWRGAWRIYSRLAVLYDHEPRYQQLEHEAITHLRLDTMFKEGSHWDEYVEKVRWRDARRALMHLERYYVEPTDFRKIAESGLQQLLWLADSKSAKEHFDGLKDDADRNDFKSRVQARLDRLRKAPAVDEEDCADHFRAVVNEINPQTIRLPEELIVSELMRGAFEPLDDFTTIIWPSASKEFDKHTRGDFVGVGISIIKNRADEIEVVTPLEDSSAYRAGVQAGDVITHVDGEGIKGFSINKVVDTITGPTGTAVTLTIRRDGKAITFPLERNRVKIRSVKGVRRDPNNEERWDHWLDREMGIGYIRLLSFQKNTVEDVDNALSELSAHGLKGLILDLRNNPGGLLDAACELSARFLNRGDVIVSTKGRITREDRIYEAPGQGPYADIPIVVLVDERSASASEIVSGAIRDNGRGLVLGERTFGKFSVQNLIPLTRSGAKLKITTARYYLPSGVSLHRCPTCEEWGVEPDLPLHLVNKEVRNVFTLWREANLLGPPKVNGDEIASAEKAESPDAAPGESPHGGADDHNSAGVKAGEAVAGVGESASETKADGVNDASGEGDAAATGAEIGEDGLDDEDAEDKPDPKLPPIEQPDENNRPKEDPQLDTAVLILRMAVLADTHPTVAAAENEPSTKSAKP